VRAAVEALVQAGLEAKMTEAIGAKGERETRLSHRSGYYSRSLIIRGWHAAVAGAAGSDKPMRETEYFRPAARAKPHCPLRDPRAKPPLGRPEANGRVIAMSAGKSV
jgi:hypothetical protein